MKDIYRNAKATYCLLYESCRKESGKRYWAKRVAFCDNKLKQCKGSGILELMRRVKILVIAVKILVIAVNVAVLLTIVLTTSCNAVGGLGRDITWMGEAGQEMLEHGHEAMEK
jgi:predicted small secreted protein